MTGKPLTLYLDCDPEYPEHIKYVHTQPILPLGSVGSYDQDGTVPSSCMHQGDHLTLYYTGWNTKDFQQYQVTAACARSYDQGQTFVTAQPLILLGCDFLNTMSPWVIKHERYYYMWFAASSYWTDFHGQIEAIYQIYQAVSDDGWTWIVDPQPAFPPQQENESANRPTVWFDGKEWHMWFGYKNPQNEMCRIGYATSQDLRHWQRNDSLSTLDLSTSGWDSEMQTDPAIIQYQKNLLLFYNGNGHGQSGFGYASIKL